MKIKRQQLTSGGVLLILLFLTGCSASQTTPSVQPTLDLLLTEVSSQATRLAKQDDIISYLATRMPSGVRTPVVPSLPTPFVTGSIQIEDGRCCAGGLAGQTIGIRVEFQASSPVAEVTHMRLRTGTTAFEETDFSESEWEPFEPQRVFDYNVPVNWTGFYVTAQFRDALGNRSSVYSADISVEGMPPTITAPAP